MKAKHTDKFIPFLADDKTIEDEDCGELLTVLTDDDGMKYCSSSFHEAITDSFTCKKCLYSRSMIISPKSMVYYLHVGESKEKVTIQTLLDSSLVEVLDTDFRCRYCYHKAANGGIQPTEEDRRGRKICT